MKIWVITPRFAIAGVPLAQVRFARALARQNHQVTLIIGFVEKNFELPSIEGIEIKVLGIPKVRWMLFSVVRLLSNENPDIIFSAEDHLNVLVSIAAILSRSKVKLSCSSRVTPYDTYSDLMFSKRWLLKKIANYALKRANVLTCVSSDMVSQYHNVFDKPRHVCVHNIIYDAETNLRMREDVDHPWLVSKTFPVIIAAGRLAPWKGFSDLISAISIVSNQRIVRLLILGDGPDRFNLQNMIDRLGLGSVIDLVGYVSNPLKYFSNSDVFVLSSLVEGLPNVLVEAMMSGCTPVSTNCPTGPREVLQDGKYGYLVPVGDPKAMADGIIYALDHPIAKQQLLDAVEPFREENIINRHFDLLGVKYEDRH